VSRLRRHPIVRVTVLVMLTWTAVDLLAPQLCAAEASQPSAPAAAIALTAAPQDQIPPAAPAALDDCFCCSHSVRPVMQAVILADVSPVGLPATHAESQSAGIVRPLFRPPLFS
jgi:hypothetical protein